MKYTLPCRTLCAIFIGSFCVLSVLTSATDPSVHHAHSMHHSSISEASDATAATNGTTSTTNASDATDKSHLHNDHEEFRQLVSETNDTNHVHHDHDMDHHGMMQDQAQVAKGNDLSKVDGGIHTVNKDYFKVDHDSHDGHDGHGKDHDMNHDGSHDMDHDGSHDMDHDGSHDMDHDGSHDMVDHDGHGGHNHMQMNGSDMHGMKMWFHTGVDEVILFKEWKVTTVGGLIGSMAGILLLAMFYEGLKYFREYLFKQYISSMQFATVAVTGESGRVTQVHKVEKHRMMSVAHTIQTCLHVVQIVISYFLMLIFMTYNLWLCLAVVLGAGLGYFIFGWKKATVVDITEHCH